MTNSLLRGARESKLVIAHRGASAERTGNTLEAFERAIELGADMIEFDVRRTRDEKLIVFHDATAGGTPIAQLRRGEIARHAGHRPPLLDEVLELADGRIGLDVELKEDGYVGQVVARLERRIAAGDTVVTSFLDDVVFEAKQHAPQLKAGLLLGVARPKPWLRTRFSEIDPVRRAQACAADFIAPHTALARLGAVENARKAGFPALVWTVNDAAALKRLFAEAPIAGVITDWPDRALQQRAAVNGTG